MSLIGAPLRSINSCLSSLQAVKEEKAEIGSFLESLASTTAPAVHSLSFHPEKCEMMTAARGNVYIWKKKADVEGGEEDGS